ncbi:MAG: sugar ABC transporter permease [Caldilineaceae bacterium]
MTTTALSAPGVPRKRRGNRLLRQEYLAFYLFASPWLLGLILFTVGPMIASFLLSFADYPVIVAPKWIGLQNYTKMFTEDKLVWQALKVTLLYSVGAIPLTLIFSFCIATLLNQGMRGVTVFRTIYYLPAVISGVPVALLWMWMLNPEFGLVNNVLKSMGIPGPPWFFSTTWVIPSFIIMNLWGIGVTMVVFLAGLQGIPAHLYEAAEIDGAGMWSRFLHVTLPMMSPIILFNTVIGIIDSFQIFTPALIVTNGGPANASLFYGLYLYNNAFRFLHMGYASALAWLMFLIILVLTVLVFRSTNAWVYYEGTVRK